MSGRARWFIEDHFNTQKNRGETSKEQIRLEKAFREGTRRDALTEGKAEGLQEGEANIYKIAIKNTYKTGHSIGDISTIMGLPQEEIIKILQIIQNEGLL